MHKIKEIIKNNSNIIFLLVAIAIVTNIVIVYTLTYIFSDKENNIEEINIKSVSQKSPIVVDVSEDLHKEIISSSDNNENKENYPTGDSKYYIKVNLKTQTVNIYEKDELNRYSVPVKTMLCSTGEYTPKLGTYKITTYKQEWLGLQGNVYGQYCTQIIGNILFHSVPYLEKYNPASLEYWEYDKLGQDVSLGCIRLTVENAKWIYDNCDAGTRSGILFIR
ncbi:MAG: L,D-transpeptidase [Clostridia bacterium]|nr:L,D-transpeptidase [Clostridia bacterium]